MLNLEEIEDYPTTISRDLFRLICGEKLGGGMSRTVYVFKPDPTKVIKIEDGTEKFQNILEWEIWRDISYSKYKNNFAECFFISPNGVYLIQERTEKPLKKDYPKMIPHFFGDIKCENYGIVYRKNKKHFVCHDYGNQAMGLHFKDKLKKADWKY
jgi:hypothetical protein